MNTTNLFVELLVIGCGFSAPIAMIIILIVDPTRLNYIAIESPVFLVFMAAFVYVLGIIMDRFSDQVFRPLDRRIRYKLFKDDIEYHRARTYVYINGNEKISTLFEYGRSRIRIMRSWVIVFVTLGILTPFVILKIGFLKNILTASLIGFLLEALSYFAFQGWQKLTKNDYSRLKETFEILSGVSTR